MTRAADAVLVALCVAAFGTVVALSQTTHDAFTATASVKRGSVRAEADARVEIHRYATDEERAALVRAVREADSTAVQNTLATMADAGYIQLGAHQAPIKFASRRETADGHLFTVVAATPILYLGAGLPAARPTAGFDVAIAILDVKNSASGVGELAPAAKIKIDEGGAVVIDDYGDTVVWLNRLERSR